MSETIGDDCGNGPRDQEPRSASQGSPKERCQLLLVGDCMLGRLVNEVLETAPPEYPWGDTLPILHRADWRLSNLECVISDCGTPWSASPKAFHFRSRAKNIAVLEAARMNAVSLANNHVLDYGYDAMFEMLRILDRAGIIYRGRCESCAGFAARHRRCARVQDWTDRSYRQRTWLGGWNGLAEGFLCPHRPY
jgi:poly-gamma-glutamate capsule biosynthesis protein CapA/YwtB (metallophosphatase superfamily)